MPQMNELKREIHQAKKLRLSWRTKLLMVVIGTPTLFLFLIHGGRLELVALGDYYWRAWHSDPFQMEAAEAYVVLGHYGSDRSSSCFVGSVCSLDHEVDSRIRVYWHRHSGFCSDPLDSSCCREVHGRPEGKHWTGAERDR